MPAMAPGLSWFRFEEFADFCEAGAGDVVGEVAAWDVEAEGALIVVDEYPPGCRST